jgi:hypothetical protein
MNEKLRRILADPNRIKPIQVRLQRPNKEVVAETIAARKAYSRAYGKVTGRFASRPELISFLAEEISKGQRNRSKIAADAGISAGTLWYLVKSGKVLGVTPAS